MAAKTISVRDVGATTWLDLPGNAGELSQEGNELTDTLFGQDFESSETGLINWSVSTDAMYRGFAGYVATIKRSGTSTSFTGETLSQVGTSNTYRIDDASNDFWYCQSSITILDNGATVADADIDHIDYIFGQVVFDSGYTVTGPVTADGNFLPQNDFGRAQTFEITQSGEAFDNTTLSKAQANGGYNEFRPGLLTTGLSLSGFYDTSSDFLSLLSDRERIIIEIVPDGNDKSRCRGIFKVNSDSLSGDVGDDEEESADFVLAVPNNVARPFGWEHETDTTLAESVQTVMDAWENKNNIEIKYQPEGSDGMEGEAVVTDISLSGGVSEMNEFSVDLQGTGTLTNNDTP